MATFTCSACGRLCPGGEEGSAYLHGRRLFCALCFPISELPLALYQVRMLRLRCVAVRQWVARGRAQRKPLANG